VVACNQTMLVCRQSMKNFWGRLQPILICITATLDAGTKACSTYRTTFLPNGTTYQNYTNNLTTSLFFPRLTSSTSRPTVPPTASTTPPSSHNKLSTGAYAGIGASAGLVGALALGFGIFFMMRRRRKGKSQKERVDSSALYELYDERKDPVEMEDTHGVSEAPAPVEPQELDGTAVSPLEDRKEALESR
jgi:hypothetical protein